MSSVSSSSTSTSSNGSLLQVGGLASGIDTNSMVDQLVAVEQTSVTNVQNQETDVQNQQQAFDGLVSQVTSFATTAETLADPKALDVYTPTTNDDTMATVSASAANAFTGSQTTAGSYNLVIQKLATAEKVTSQGYSSLTASLGLNGSFNISCSAASIAADPTTKAVSVNITSADSLTNIVSKINSAAGTGAQASIMTTSDGQNRLILTAVDQGTDAFTLNNVTGDALGSSGLNITSSDQTVHTNFNLLQSAGGPATSTTKFSDLFTSISGNKLQSGDTIAISGSSADGAVSSTNFTIDPATSTVGDLISQIKSTFGANTDVQLNSSGEIVLKNTGAGTGAMSMTLSYSGQNSASSMGLGTTSAQTSFVNQIASGSQAFFMLDGTPVSSQSNADSTTIVGTTFNLLKADPTKTVNVSLALNQSGVENKINDFVTAYNNLMTAFKSATQVSVTNSSGSTKQSVTAGPLANDPTTQMLQNKIQNLVTSPVATLKGKTPYTSLAMVGITTDYQTGLLTVDSTALEKAMASDMSGVKALFAATGFSSDNPQMTFNKSNDSTVAGTYQVNAAAGTISKTAGGSTMIAAMRSGDTLIATTGDAMGLSINAPVSGGSGTFTFSRGIASMLSYWAQQAQDPVNGMFTQADKTFQSEIDTYTKQVSDLQDQVDAYRSQLQSTFSSMEQTMQQLKSQSAAFTAQASSL